MGWQQQIAIRALSVLVGTTANPQIDIFSNAGVGIIEWLFNAAGIGTATLEGAAAAGPFAQVTMTGPATTTAGFLDFVQESWASGDPGVPFAASDTINYVDTNGVTHSYFIVSSNGAVINPGSVSGAVPGSSPATTDVWQSVSLAAGLSGYIKVKKVAESTGVWVDAELSAAAIGTYVCGSLPASGYYPTSTRHFSIPSNDANAQNGRIFIPGGSGALQVVFSGGAGAWAGGCSVTYPTDN